MRRVLPSACYASTRKLQVPAKQTENPALSASLLLVPPGFWKLRMGMAHPSSKCRFLGEKRWAGGRPWVSESPNLGCLEPSGSGGLRKHAHRQRPCSVSWDSLLGLVLIHRFVRSTGKHPELRSITQQAFTETAPGPSMGLSPGFGGAYNLITIIRGQLSVKLCDTK